MKKEKNRLTNWNGRNVFITGATGLVGSHLAIRLLDQGARIIALVRDQVPKSFLHLSNYFEKVNVINGVLEDYSVVERAINEYDVDTCFHLGAQTIVTTALRSPLATFRTNIMGTLNVLEACRQIGTLKRIIVSSSDKAYGNHKLLPYVEDFPLLGAYPYDSSKVCVEVLVRSYWKTFSLPVTIARCVNIYGPGDMNFSRIIPATIRAIVHEERPVIRSDGSYVRDYIYIKDVVNAYLLLAEALEREEVKGEAFNFGTENPIKVLDLVTEILNIAGSQDRKPLILNNASAEIHSQYLSSEKAKRVLGWASRYSLEEGLSETMEWYRVFLERERTS